jgi:hypothetical protein
MEDFGIKELNDAARAGSEHIPDSQLREMENLQNEISDEALNSALRIAGLVYPALKFTTPMLTLFYVGERANHEWIPSTGFIHTTLSHLGCWHVTRQTREARSY